MTEVFLNSDERIDHLVQENLKIIQSREVFSFGTDAVLLARFPKIPKKGLIMDLCAGNGAVGLMAAAETQAKILEIEIQERLADMAARSVTLNELEPQVKVICDDLKNCKNYISPSTVDLIFCNPPYFKASAEKNLNVKDSLALARHEITTNFEEICQISQQCLKPGGHLALVHRPERFFELMDTLRSHHLVPKRIQFVQPKAHSSANIVLIDAVKDGKAGGEIFLPALVVYAETGEYTDEIRKMYYGQRD